MTEISKEQLQDYGNHFNALISALRLGMDVNEYRLQMPHDYFRAKYPERYRYIIYPNSFDYRRLEIIIHYFNEQVQKTKKLLRRILKVVGDIIYGDSMRFLRAMPC